MKKKILIIVRDFIPYFKTLGGVIRILKMAEFLLKNDFEVYILAGKGFEISFFGYEKILKKIHLTYVDDLFQRYQTKDINLKQKKIIQFVGEKNNPIKEIINEFSVPDMGIFFVWRYVKKASEMIVDENIQNVLVSSPPHSTQIIGLLLKKRFKNAINLIVDYRDSWNTTKIFKKKTTLMQFLNAFLERKVHNYSDYFVYCSPPMLSKINKVFYDVSEKSLLVMNGFDPMLVPNIKTPSSSSNKILTIGYFGSLKEGMRSFRNPELFFNCLLTINKPLKIVFYGAIQINQKWKEKFKDKIEINGSVSHNRALLLMNEVDVLMLLHSQKEGADEVITSKIFEYMLIEKPILVVGPKVMEAAKIVKQHGIGYTMDLYDDLDMRHKLLQIFHEWENGNLPSYSFVDMLKYSRENQNLKLLHILR